MTPKTDKALVERLKQKYPCVMDKGHIPNASDYHLTVEDYRATLDILERGLDSQARIEALEKGLRAVKLRYSWLRQELPNMVTEEDFEVDRIIEALLGKEG